MKKLTKKFLQEQYKKESTETFPKYSGDFEKDLELYKPIVKERLEEIEEQKRIEGLRLRDIKYAQQTFETVGKAPNERKQFKVGESVVCRHGGFISAEIIEILSEGIYDVLIHFETTKPYSKETYKTQKTMVLGWWDLFKYVEDKAPSTLGKELFINFMQQTIFSLIHKYFNYRGIDMNPSYQRGLVWTDSQKEELLDSIFNYIDIGKFVFVKLPYEKGGYSYQILDGKQKLTTIIDFYSDKFKYRGFYYSELPWDMKYCFLEKSISVGEVSDRTFDEKLILEYFVKLNSTGTPMNKKHLKNIKSLLDIDTP